MAQSGYTPILLYGSNTASSVPSASNLTSSTSGVELALNYTDGKLYYKDNSGVVQLLASKAAAAGVLSFSAGSTGLTPSTATSGAVTLAGTLGISNGGTGITSFGTGVQTALGVNVGTAGSFLVNGGVLGTPSSGTVTNLTGTASININGTVGATTPSTGVFTTLTDSGLTSGRVTYAGTGGLLQDSANLTFDGTNFTVNGTVYLGGTSTTQSLRVTPVASAVNYWNFYGSTTGNSIAMYALGSDANIGVSYLTKGTGYHFFYSNSAPQFAIANTTSAVNYLQIQGSTAGGGPVLSAQGTDTNITSVYLSKNTGSHYFATGGGQQFNIAHTASAVNYLQVTGNVTAGAPTLSAAGSDANVSLAINAKAIGTINFGNAAGLAFRVRNDLNSANYFDVFGSGTGSGPILRAEGSDANILLSIASKGTSPLIFQTNQGTEQFRISHTASAVDYIQVQGSASGFPLLSAQGASANSTIVYAAKGTGGHNFVTNASFNNQFAISNTASAVNYLTATGAPTTGPVSLTAQGSDTNINLYLAGKGTGVLQFGTYTAGTVVQAGYITISDAAGNTRRLLVG